MVSVSVLQYVLLCAVVQQLPLKGSGKPTSTLILYGVGWGEPCTMKACSIGTSRTHCMRFFLASRRSSSFVCSEVSMYVLACRRYANCVGGTFLFNPSETTQYDICYHNGAVVTSIAVSSGGMIRNSNNEDPDPSQILLQGECALFL